MKFYMIGPRPSFAGYWPEALDANFNALDVPPANRQHEHLLREYLGNPPRRPGKHGTFHRSADGYFFAASALPLLIDATSNRLEYRRTVLIGREAEEFYQVWVKNSVDCLDIEKTRTIERVRHVPGRIGVITKPVFDELRWDKSDLFTVPQDSSFCYFCTETFVEKWKAQRFKGAEFSTGAMDMNPVLS